MISQPSIAVQPKPFGGSLTLNDVQDPVVIDVATGSPNLRLQGIESQVGATDPSLVDAVPLAAGTLLDWAVYVSSGVVGSLSSTPAGQTTPAPPVSCVAVPGHAYESQCTPG